MICPISTTDASGGDGEKKCGEVGNGTMPDLTSKEERGWRKEGKVESRSRKDEKEETKKKEETKNQRKKK